jgi:cell wall-associated NlpC family hydrolase
MLVSPGKEDADVVGSWRLLVFGIVVLVAAGCAPKRILRDGGVTPEPLPPTTTRTTPSDLGARAVVLAKEQVGTPYAFGGGDPQAGFDCSGLVQWTYGRLGIALPRSVKELAAVGQPVATEDLRAGDLLFFSTRGGDRPDHVGIYAEKHRFVHAPSRGSVVRTESLNDAWWRRRWIASRRVD